LPIAEKPKVSLKTQATCGQNGLCVVNLATLTTTIATHVDANITQADTTLLLVRYR
jgi:kynurenine formamidase